jgi:hypothetical protein
MVELMVALVSIVALFAGLVQMVSLSSARHRTQYQARSEAGAASLDDIGGGGAQLSDAEYIEDWETGNDERRHTRDDLTTSGDTFPFELQIVAPTSPDEAGWDIIEQAPGDQFSMLLGAFNPAPLFGIVEGEADEEVPLLPAVQSLLYDAESIEVESRVWMTWTRGIY